MGGTPSPAARDAHSHPCHGAPADGPPPPAGALELLMSPVEIWEANEALGDVGESGGCPGEGRGLLFLCWFVLVFDSGDQVPHSAL